MSDGNKFIPYNTDKKAFARNMRKHPSYSEKLMWQMLRKDQLGYRFLRQKPIGPYVADFYCAKLRLCIEVDGPHHASTKQYDVARDAYFLEHGIIVYRVNSGELVADPDAVGSKLERWIGELEV